MDLFKKLNDFILTITSRNENFWEQRKLGEMITERKILRFDSREFPLSSFIKNEGVVPKSSRYDRSFLVKSNSKKYKETRLGDFIYSSNNLDTGSIGLNNYGNAVISPVYSIFTSKDTENLETSFINLLFKKNFYKNKMLRFRQGVTYGQWKIKENDFLNLKVYISNSVEIEKIIAIFSKISQCITLYDRKLKLVKLIYKELENKVYNNDLIKQTNFTKVKLGEILKEKNIKSTYEDQYPVLSSTNSGIGLRNGRTNSSSNVGYKVLSKNELVLSPQNLWLGNININFNFRNGLVSPSYKVFSLTNNINIIYLNSLLHHPKMMYLYKVVSVQGASVVRRNLDIEAFENLTLKLPSIEAQNKIGNLLNKNRQLIDSLEKKKDQISKIKTTLLNTMFI